MDLVVPLRDGDIVRLRNGTLAGPLRDRKHENDMWPWGEKCSKCGHELHNKFWRPDGKASHYSSDPPFENDLESPFDIVEIVEGTVE